MTIFKLSTLSFAIVLSGCVAVPHLSIEKIDNIPHNISINVNEKNEGKLAGTLSTQWWEQLHDTQLNELIKQALRYNDDMRLALNNIQKTQTNIDLAHAATLPDVSLNGSVTREKFSESGLIPPPYGGETINFTQLSLKTLYDVDIWGKYNALISEQVYLLKAMELKKEYLVTTISYQVTKQYLYWQMLQVQKNLMEQEIALGEENTNISRQGVQLGKLTEQNVLSIDNDTKNLRIELKNIQNNIHLTENNLQVLLGHYDMAQLHVDSAVLDKSFPIYQTVSSDVVTQRPDVAYYLAIIEAQKKRLYAYKTDFYPTLSISGELGLQKIGLSDVFSLKNLFYNIGPSITLPVFDSGRIKGNYRLAGLDLNEFITQYNQAVMKSYYDVNTNLYKVHNNQAMLGEQERVFANNTKDYQFNEKKWAIGKVARLDWNQYQSLYLQNQYQYANSKFNFLSSQLDLILSMGGSFSENNNK